MSDVGWERLADRGGWEPVPPVIGFEVMGA